MLQEPGSTPAGGVRAALEAAYEGIDRALGERDLERALAWLSPDFTATLADGGTADLAGQAALLRHRLAGTRRIGPAHVAIESLAEEATTGVPDRATAVVCWSCISLRLDPADPAGTAEDFEEARFRDIWVLRSGRWLLERREAVGPAVEGGVRQDVADGPRIARLRAEIAAGDDGAVERLWAEMAGHAPLIEPDERDPGLALVTFLWRSDRPEPASVGGGLMWTTIDKPLTRLGDTDVWYRTERLPVTGRFNYWFSYEEHRLVPREITITRQVPDPLNARPSEGASWFALPGAPAQPHADERPGVVPGTLARSSLRSATLGEDRPYSVHLPAGYRADAADNRLVVLLDGEIYGGGPEPCVPAPRIVDSLVADGLIPPVALLLVHNLPGMRARDLVFSADFAAFVARELVPEVQVRHHAGLRPEHVVLGGSSYGGLAATFGAVRHPDVFGNVLSMSGAFYATPDWPPASSSPFGGAEGLMMRELSASPRLPLRFWLDVGRFELAIQVLTNRHLRNVLELKGYPVTYTEFDGGHTYSAWRGSLADGLASLLGAGPGEAGTRAADANRRRQTGATR